MSLIVALAAFASVAGGVSATCVPLAEAAAAAGLTALVDAVASVSELEAAAALIDVSLMNVTEEATPITVFAPTNEAFMEIASVAATLEPEMVLAVLYNHILPTEEDAASIIAAGNATVTTVLGTDLEISVVGESVFVTSGDITAEVTTTDVPTCAGIVHVIDKVLVPILDAAAGSLESMAPMLAEAPVSISDTGSYGSASAPGSYA